MALIRGDTIPTENERKYIIKTSCENNIIKASSKQYDISQGYLIATRGITVRIRKLSKRKSKKVNYFFTLKSTTNGRNIEIETKLDERDFNDLWSIALNKLEKLRCIIRSKDVWEVDFFKDYKNRTYIAIAEVELPENRNEPYTIPKIIKNNLIYSVPLTDTRFSNKLIGDARYASQLLKETRKEL